MNRQRERAVIHGVCRRFGVTAETCAQYPMFVEALLTEGVDEILRGRLVDDEQVQPGPAVRALRNGGMWPERVVWAAIESQAKGIKPADITEAAQAWLLNGNKKGNVDGVLRWARTGQRSNFDAPMPTKASQPARPTNYLPDDPASL